MGKIRSGLPDMEIKEEGDFFIVRIKISGFVKKDVQLEVKENFLRIKLERKYEEKENEFFKREWKSVFFEGEIFLPSKVIPIVSKKDYDGKVFEIRLEKDKERE